jgi:hypothetical protein
MQVVIEPTSLKISLSWFGAILDGSLSNRIKSTEATWSFEGHELMMMLPKGDENHTWRSLIQG